MTKTEIEAKYLQLHFDLGRQEDAVDVQTFDRKHCQIWSDCDRELEARKAELEAQDELSLTEENELGEIGELFPVELAEKGWREEIEELSVRVKALEKGR